MSHFRIIDIDRTEADGITEPLSLEDAKKWIKVTFTDDDDVITDIISDARKTIEEFCSVSIVETDIVFVVEMRPANNRSRIDVELPYGPVNIEAVTLVERSDCGDNGVYETMTEGEDYYFLGSLFPKIVVISPGIYRITYAAGYSAVPSKLVDAMKSEIANQYDNRGDENRMGISEMAKRKSQPYKRMAWL